ncbi:GNAT family N-acetyltransferase [Mangrovicoccus sp. HB182678]|uniref:GNAT family N-acetyltransferase n=2 Tax=Mangrovicoccus algicola TaxID=2771008 RepID=A0A8J7D056_9RHOB|nr:GNAT family N-acetyltransferase [Mangrovicoccus algicola]MBE3638983.1 GNAT family N-acetyltransferase [Mangrovicoccus algicola]
MRRALAATWPAAEEVAMGPFMLRRSAGGGQRVTAARALPGAEGLAAALPRAVAQMQAWGQRPVFQILPDTPGLDALLEGGGWAVGDPTIVHAAPLSAFGGIATPPLSTFAHWPPLAIQEEIWGLGGIGRDRLAVMARVAGPHVSLLARDGDRPAGTAFVAMDGPVAMIHAMEISPALRRRGNAARLLARAAAWAAGRGGEVLALAVTEANAGARALYAGLGMRPVLRYHYRVPAP